MVTFLIGVNMCWLSKRTKIVERKEDCLPENNEAYYDTYNNKICNIDDDSTVEELYNVVPNDSEELVAVVSKIICNRIIKQHKEIIALRREVKSLAQKIQGKAIVTKTRVNYRKPK